MCILVETTRAATVHYHIAFNIGIGVDDEKNLLKLKNHGNQCGIYVEIK